MAYDNVNLWFAKDENENIVTISDVDENNRHEKYYCPLCGSDLIPKAIKEDAQVTSHFAHVDRSKCNGESMVHFWFKNKFLVPGDKFIIKADIQKEYVCKEVLVEQTYQTEFGDYRPDITVITECGKNIYFEMEYSNKKKLEDYIDKWLVLRNIVVEVDLKTLMNSSKEGIYQFNALFYNGRCFNTKKKELYYDTIGKYKESVYKEKCSEDIKERLNKLDWFWLDINRYNNGKLDIDYMSQLIDNIQKEEQEIVFNILEKPKCTQLYKEYRNNQKKIYKEKIASKIKEIESEYNNLVKITCVFGVDKHFVIFSKLKGEKDWSRIIGSSYGGSYDLNRDIDYINRQIECELNSIKQEKQQDELIKNDSLIKAIELINNKYKSINDLYDFELRWNGGSGTVGTLYHVYIECKYNKCRIHNFVIDITNEDICRSKDIDAIVIFISLKVEKYREGITPLRNLDILLKIIENINNKLKQIKPIKNKHYFYLKSFHYEEDILSIDLQSPSMWFDCHFYIKGDQVNYNYKPFFNLKNTDYKRLEEEMFKIISMTIRNERYKK